MAARVLLILFVFAIAPQVHALRLAADLSSKEVAISTGFSGAELLLFGATEGYGDIVVTVLGPLRDEVFRRKPRVNKLHEDRPSAESAGARQRTPELTTARRLRLVLNTDFSRPPP